MMLALPSQASSFHSAVSTAADLPTGDPAGWARVVIDELAIYISDGSAYSVYPAPAAPFAFASKSVQKQEDSGVQEELEIMRKSVQGAYDLIASMPKPEPVMQMQIVEPDNSVEELKAQIKQMNTELVYLYEQHEKHESEIDSLHAQIVARDKQIEDVEDTLSRHAVKLDKPVTNIQFPSVVQFLLWLISFGYFDPQPSQKDHEA